MSELSLTSAEMVVQYGFAGFSIVLLGVLIWLLRKFIELQKQTIDALNENTDVTRGAKQKILTIEKTTFDIRDKLQSRPCIAKKE